MRDGFKDLEYAFEPREDARFAAWEPELADDDDRLTYSEWVCLRRRCIDATFGDALFCSDDEVTIWCVERLIEFEDRYRVASALFQLRARAEEEFDGDDGVTLRRFVDDAWLDTLSCIDPYAAEYDGCTIALGSPARERYADASK